MESLVNYGSDDESGDYNDFGKNTNQSQHRVEEDANYDEIGMDESSEESNNNNHAESHFSAAAREKQENHRSENSKDSLESTHLDHSHESSNFVFDERSKSKSDDEFSQDKQRKESLDGPGTHEWKGDCSLSKSDEASRRHSSDMEMDDGEDDLNNYEDTTLNYRQKLMPKNINFTKGKNLGEDFADKKYHETFVSSSGKANFNSEKVAGEASDSRSVESEKNLNSEESQRIRDEKMRRERKVLENKRKDDCKDRKREDDKWKESDRDRKRESEKYRDDRDRKRSPDRYNKKRSHSPDRKDRDRDYDRERDRGRSRERDRDRSREYGRERNRERDRDRDREHWSGDRRSPKHFRRSSKSPDRSWKTRKLEKKAAVLNKLGIELKTDVTGNLTPRQLLGEQLKAQIQEVEAKTGVTLPTYYNPGVMNPLKYAQQIQKRKLLWGNKNNEVKTSENPGQSSSVPSTVKQWEAATFKGDNDGKMTEKFKRLMGIKGDASTCNVGPSSSKPPETKEIIQKQEEMFSNMEAQYQVARMATHTHRGVGLGFGTFQVPPR